ncbi:MAG: SRPBCC family protein [Burkholderiales bacterium]|nr:SRPBCC family protein [Bacteroidia bacterium]
MKFYSIKSVQQLPISLGEAWDFFSSPNNLAKITPADMGFVITSDKKDGEKMYPGQIITYIIKPLLGIPIKWMTEITHVKEGDYFIDEQRFGPYKLWHHKHSFKKTSTGVEMHDEVNYVLPFGFLGTVAHLLFIRKRIEYIFEYRTKFVDNFFGN